MENKKNGTAFEDELCRLLSQNGCWAHKLQDNRNGQPFDVIAARNGTTLVIDCKDCQGDVFPISRVEENQINAMQLWEETGNSTGWFAFRFGDGSIWFAPYDVIISLKNAGKKRLNKKNIMGFGYNLRAIIRRTSWI